MAEKQVKKKEIQEFKNYSEFVTHASTGFLPGIFIYTSLDSFEFDLVTDTYRTLMAKNGPFETVVYVAETGDFEKLFSEMFNFSMFSAQKLLIIRSGSDFFKPILLAGKKEQFESFKRNIPNLSDQTCVLIHYDAKDLPAKMFTLFDNKFALLKSRNFYQDERKPALEAILKAEKVNLEEAAKDEFLYRIPPNTGSYTKSIRKLKLILNKKDFTLQDVEEVLFSRADFSPFHQVDLLFQKNRMEFFREFSKLKSDSDTGTASYLSLLNALLNRLDETRKARLLLNRLGENDPQFFKYMGMESYSDNRKWFTKNKLKKETKIFNEEAMSFLYDLILELNIRAKVGSMKEMDHYFFIREFEKLFRILEKT